MRLSWGAGKLSGNREVLQTRGSCCLCGRSTLILLLPPLPPTWVIAFVSSSFYLIEPHPPSLFSQCCIPGDVTMKLAHITPLDKTFQILDIKAKIYTMTYLICLCAALYPTPHSQALGSIYSLPWALWLQPQWPFLKPLNELHYYPEFCH